MTQPPFHRPPPTVYKLLLFSDIAAPQSATMNPFLGDPLWQGDVQDFLEAGNINDQIDTSIQDSRVLTSYSWVGQSSLRLEVPGLPPSFREFRMPLHVEPGKGLSVTDENFYRKPSCPIEPLFEAIYQFDSEYDPRDLDLVTDDNNLQDLFSAIMGDDIQNFRIDIQIIGKTMIFTRWHKNVSEYPTCPQYEKNFVEAITFGNHAHYRIIQFQWGGLNIVERCSIDARNPEARGFSIRNRVTPQVNSNSPSSDILSRTSHVSRGGVLVSQESLFQVISWPDLQKINMDLLFPRLFFSQVSNVLIGLHRNGTFDWIDVRRDVNNDIHSPDTLMSWKERMAPGLRAVILVIKAIRRILRKWQQNVGMVVVEEGQMKIYGGDQERSNGIELLGKLPDQFMMRWNNNGGWRTR